MVKELSYHTEEKWNAISHAIGVVFGIVALFFLLRHNSDKTEYAQLSIIIYSMSFIILFLASTLYHSVSNPGIKRKLRILDHISIYVLIAGTYTPMALITLVDGKGWLIFYVVWGIAAVGTLLKLFFTGKFEAFSLILYIAMGWLIVLDFPNLLEYSSRLGLKLLFLGGAFYTVGTIFYAWKRIPYNHFIWHLFVLGGALSHWLLIYCDVV
ncbi:PAQR family membrane homeostasis protein TrhA [Maribacter polysaccharolyticus]|uniref:PAQR family membrane homeostasis protein TrhA n=1 Tax=Maribacter polysaccharolyticus TaxID=3020831 RepID=UPI00237F0B8C|nr:hemolysin III family protein [Maribacter polysaccharolyticus]MDE3743765.1 hemolysin III family protein [Maribacter polysaccharolyticus]